MNSIHVARVLLVTRMRNVLYDKDRRRAQVITLLLFTPLLYQLVQYGVSASSDALLGYGQLLPVTAIGLTATQAFKTLQEFGSFDGIEQLAPVASMRSAVAGYMLADTLMVAAVLGLPVVLVTVPMAVSTGAILTPLLAVLGLLAVLFPVAVCGTLLGMIIKRFLAGYQGGHTVLFRLVLFGASFILIQAAFRGGIDAIAIAGPAGERLLSTLLAPVTGASASLSGAVLLLGLPLAGIGLLPVTARLTEHVWLHDPGASAPARIGGSAFTSDGIRLYARTLWLRGFRSPERFSHLLIAVFMLFPMGGAALRFPPLAALLLLFGGAWLIGAGFCLNPVGDDADQLPLLFHLDLSIDQLLWGRVLAGLVAGLPLIVAGALLGPVLGLPMALVPVTAAAAVLLGLTAAGIGLGLGTVAPRYDAVQRFGAVTARTPTTIPMIGHLLVSQVGFGMLMIAVYLPAVFNVVPVLGGLQTWVIRIILLTITGSGLAVAGAVGWWFAARRLRGHEIGDR